MNQPGQGFLALSFIPIGGFIVSRGLESGTGTPIEEEEVAADTLVEGRRQTTLNAYSRGAPEPVIYRSKAKKDGAC